MVSLNWNLLINSEKNLRAVVLKFLEFSNILLCMSVASLVCSDGKESAGNPGDPALICVCV